MQGDQRDHLEPASKRLTNDSRCACSRRRTDASHPVHGSNQLKQFCTRFSTVLEVSWTLVTKRRWQTFAKRSSSKSSHDKSLGSPLFAIPSNLIEAARRAGVRNQVRQEGLKTQGCQVAHRRSSLTCRPGLLEVCSESLLTLRFAGLRFT